MRYSTLRLLNKELKNHKYDIWDKVTPDGVRYFGLRHLFELYLKSEIRSIKDIHVDVEEFRDFIIMSDFRQSMGKGSQQTLAEVMDTMLHSYDFFHNVYLTDGTKKRLTTFANIVTDISKHCTDSILEVGSTRMPYASFVMAKKCKDVTAMDFTPDIIDSYFDNLGVKFRNEYLRPDTDVSSHGMIVGRHPCGAIETIVSMCSKDKKPYFIELCDCEFQGKPYDDIVEYLKTKDKSLRGVDRLSIDSGESLQRLVYVHNLDMSDKQVKDILLER